MKKQLIPAIILFATLTSLLFIRLGQASTINVGTYDATGDPKETFAIGELVRIKASSTHKPIRIEIRDPDNLLLHQEEFDGYEYDQTFDHLTQKHGWHTVIATSRIDEQRTNYGCVYFNVIPEVPLGIVSATTTMLLGLGFYGFIRHKKPSYTKHA